LGLGGAGGGSGFGCVGSGFTLAFLPNNLLSLLNIFFPR